MDRYSIPAPGHTLGPCTAKCSHFSCALFRAVAGDVCKLCGDEIGYETNFDETNISRAHTACVAAHYRDEAAPARTVQPSPEIET